MGLLSWILLGAAVGLVANRVAPGRFPGRSPGTVVGGVLGAVVGGLVMAALAGRGIAGFDLSSFLLAFGGAALLLALLRAAGHTDTAAAEVRERR